MKEKTKNGKKQQLLIGLLKVKALVAGEYFNMLKSHMEIYTNYTSNWMLLIAVNLIASLTFLLISTANMGEKFEGDRRNWQEREQVKSTPATTKCECERRQKKNDVALMQIYEIMVKIWAN